MPTIQYSNNPNSDTAFVVQDGGQKNRAVLTAEPAGTLQLSDSANVSTGYVTDEDGKKHKVNLVAQLEGEVEFSENPNSTKGYVTDEDGKKHRVVLTASLHGGGSAPVIDELNVTPSTSAQVITAPEGTDGYSPVNVAAVTSAIDSNIVAGNIKKDVSILGVTGSYEGPTPEYPLLSRVKDDSNNEIGTVCGYHTDANNVKYAVVCLDAQYRTLGCNWLNSTGTVTGLAELGNRTAFDNTDTATSNCDKILSYANTKGYTSTSVNHCRSQSFIIEGTTYYGQLPNIGELLKIFLNRTAINNLDTSASSYPSYIVPASTSVWASTQYNSNWGWILHTGGTGNSTKTTYNNMFVIPILEIPITA